MILDMTQQDLCGVRFGCGEKTDQPDTNFDHDEFQKHEQPDLGSSHGNEHDRDTRQHHERSGQEGGHNRFRQSHDHTIRTTHTRASKDQKPKTKSTMQLFVRLSTQLSLALFVLTVSTITTNTIPSVMASEQIIVTTVGDTTISRREVINDETHDNDENRMLQTATNGGGNGNKTFGIRYNTRWILNYPQSCEGTPLSAKVALSCGDTRFLSFMGNDTPRLGNITIDSTENGGPAACNTQIAMDCVQSESTPYLANCTMTGPTVPAGQPIDIDYRIKFTCIGKADEEVYGFVESVIGATPCTGFNNRRIHSLTTDYILTDGSGPGSSLRCNGKPKSSDVETLSCGAIITVPDGARFDPVATR